MSLNADAASCLAWSARLCCAGLLWQSLELGWIGRELRDGRLLGRAEALGAVDGSPVSPFVASGGRDRFFLAGRALAAASLLVLPFGTAASGALLVLLFAGQLYFNRRFERVLANADHLNLLSLAGLAAAGWPGASAGLRGAALAFIAFHGLLGYVAAGIDKLAAPRWRNGERLVAVFHDSSHGVPWLARVASCPPFGALLSWGTILLEVFFPVCLVLPPAGFWVFIAAAASFHLIIAVWMGLPIFVWAFGATYPALYFVHEWLSAWWRAAPN